MMAGDQRILTEKNMGESDLFWKILVFFFFFGDTLQLSMESSFYYIVICNFRTYEKLSPVARRPSSSLRSPQQDLKDRKDLRKRESAFSPSPERSPTVSESPPRLTRKRSTSEDRWLLCQLSCLILMMSYNVYNFIIPPRPPQKQKKNC